MRKSIYHYFLLIFVLLAGPGYGQSAEKPKLEFDHILIFTRDHALKDSLDKIFTPAEKLTTEHTHQGTIGHYYLFYNTYIELLFLTDSTRASENVNNFGSDYVKRWEESGPFCPIGFGMLMTRWPKTIENLPFRKYQSSDSPDGEYYLMSEYNNDPSQPMIYVSMPKRAYESLDSIQEVMQRPEEIRADLRKYLTHDSGVKSISQIIYTYTKENEAHGNLDILKNSPGVEVKSSESASLTLVFDSHGNQQKQLLLNNGTKLILKY